MGSGPSSLEIRNNTSIPINGIYTSKIVTDTRNLRLFYENLPLMRYFPPLGKCHLGVMVKEMKELDELCAAVVGNHNLIMGGNEDLKLNKDEENKKAGFFDEPLDTYYKRIKIKENFDPYVPMGDCITKFPYSISGHDARTFKYKISPVPEWLVGIAATLAGLLIFAPLAVPMILSTLKKHYENRLYLKIYFDDGTVDAISFNLRQDKTPLTRFAPAYKILTLHDLKHYGKDGLDKEYDCLMRTVFKRPVDDTSTGKDFKTQCAIAVMKVEGTRDHLLSFHCDTNTYKTTIILDDTVGTLSSMITMEMMKNASKRMKRERFKEAARQLQAALQSAYSAIMQELIKNKIQAATIQNANKIKNDALKSEANDKTNQTNKSYEKAKELFNVAKVRSNDKQVNQHLDNIIEALQNKIQGNVLVDEARKLNIKSDALVTTSNNSQDSNHRLKGADKADGAAKKYDDARKHFDKASRQDLRLGFLQSTTVESVLRMDSRGKFLRMLAYNNLVRDINFERSDRKTSEYGGSESVEFEGKLVKYDRRKMRVQYATTHS